MHFWIDKRSQQCGFGRSRVAASLSASGGGGVGLGFGHPPRRMHSGSKSSSSSISAAAASGSNHISAIHSTARQHQQQQQHQHHHHQQYATNNPSTSAATSAEHSASRNFQQPQLINNNNFPTCTANSRSSQQQQHNQVNNNAHQMQQQQQPFNNLSAGTSSSHTLPQPNAINNNHQSHQRGNAQSGLSTTAAAMHNHHHHHHHYQHDMRYHHPQFGNMSVRHYLPQQLQQPPQPAQPSPINSNAASDERTNSMPSVHRALVTPTVLNNLNDANSPSSNSTPYRNNLNIVAGPQATLAEQQARAQQLHLMPHVYGTLLHDAQHSRCGTSSQQQQQQQQQQTQQPTNRQSLNYQTSSPRSHMGVQCTRANAMHTAGAPNVLLTNANVATNNDNRSGSPAIFSDASAAAYHHHHHAYHHQQQQQQQQQQPQQQHHQQHSAHHRQLHALIDPAETQLLPSHLKSGVCASLVLASIFVAAAKFYFDHQNSGLEVLIFIAFSMTFLLAACTVSLCRIPKGIIVQRPSSVHAEHAARSAYSAAADAAVGVGVGGALGSGGSAMLQRSTEHGGLNASCQQVLYARPLAQEHALAAQAGPPPYHIAILLPENGCKEEESPPPSYDKILI